MQRRSFLSSLGTSAALLSATPALAADSKPVPRSLTNFTEVPAVLPGDLEAYFTEEKLRRTIDTSASLQGIKFETVAYNFPAWHPSPFMEKFFGKGWTEFEVLKRAQPLYPGHLLPKYPLWGYFDEADPEWAEHEIDASADFGVNVWMIDWYWHNGTQFYHEQLENGFLKASNRSRLKFAIMWANHDWGNIFPQTTDEEAMLLPQHHSEDDMLRVMDYCIEHYFRQPNYWRIDGQPVFAIFNLKLLLDAFSGYGLKRIFEKMRERVAKAGLGDLHLQASQLYRGHEAELKSLGFDSATSYHTFAGAFGQPPGSRTPYGKMAERSIQFWRENASKLSVPYFPDCPVGWDDTPRDGSGSRMVTERTPDQYERLLRAGQYFSAGSSVKPKVVFLSSWNEWTEDHVLLPDTYYGYGYLEAIRRVFRG